MLWDSSIINNGWKILLGQQMPWWRYLLGGANTYAATAGFALVEIASGIDRLVIMTTGAAGVRSYVTQFNTTSNPFDHIF
jgi:hypothetical protein